MDEQQIKDQYRAFYRAAIAKDKARMNMKHLEAMDNASLAG